MTPEQIRAFFGHDPTNFVPVITKRDWFAGLALQGILASRQNEDGPNDVASTAIKYADVLLKRLAESNPEAK